MPSLYASLPLFSRRLACISPCCCCFCVSQEDEKSKLAEPEEDAEPTEKSPLKAPSSPTKDEEQANKEKSADPLPNGKDVEKESAGTEDGLLVLLSQPKLRFIFVTGFSIFLGIVFIIAVIIAVSLETSAPQYIPDYTPRMLRLIPTPKGIHSIIRYRSGHGSEGGIWPELTKEIVQLYDNYSSEEVGGKRKVASCDGQSPPNGSACFFSTEPLKLLCNARTNFGYPDGTPCVILQLNHRQLFNWTPEVYSQSDLEQNPDIPETLRKSYRNGGPYVECKGNTIVDVENAGRIEVSPKELPRNYFPYDGHADYMAPLIAVKFDKPVTAVTIGITCRVWAKNLGPRTVLDPLTNSTIVLPGDSSLPDASLPFNIYVE